MKKIALLIIALPLFSFSYELLPMVKENALEVVLKEIPLPETLSTDIQSGLTNRLLIQIILKNEKQDIIRKAFEVSIKYNLWDENFTVVTFTADKLEKSDSSLTTNKDEALNVADTEGKSKPIRSDFKSKELVLEMLKNLKFSKVINTSKLDSKVVYTIFTEVLLNPISKEKIEKMKDWVNQNSVSPPVDPTGRHSTGSIVAKSTNSFFSKIYNQYLDGNSEPTAWKISAYSRSFKIGDLIVEK